MIVAVPLKLPDVAMMVPQPTTVDAKPELRSVMRFDEAEEGVEHLPLTVPEDVTGKNPFGPR